MHVSVIIFIISLVSAILFRRRNSHQPLSVSIGGMGSTKILMLCNITSPWKERAWNILSSLKYSASLHILVECSDPTDIPLSRITDSILREYTHVEVGSKRSHHPCMTTRRLIRRFVTGDERLVIIIHDAVRPIPYWDGIIADLMVDTSPDTILTCPTTAANGVPRFPTLRKRSNGSSARNTSLPFVLHDEWHLTPSVCWCPELTAARPEVLMSLWSSSPVTDSYVAQTHSGGRHMVPNVGLLHHDTVIEDELIDYDEGSPSHIPTASELIGVTCKASSSERVLKFGSTFGARAAASMQTD